MTRKTVTYLIVGIVLIGCGFFAWNMTARAAYESAEYAVVESDGPFEIREYPELTLASTEMDFASQGNDGSFMRLFGYISGSNAEDQKLSMTTPVFMEEAEQDSKGRMGFVIPKQVAEKGAPAPNSADVTVRKRDGGRFAVVQFSGRMDANAVEQAEGRLRQWLAGKGLRGQPKAETAGYDPPWTPGPLRRNEVLIRLESSPLAAESNEQ